MQNLMPLAWPSETLRKFRARQQQAGVWRTIAYTVGVHVLPRMGIQVKHVFLLDAGANVGDLSAEEWSACEFHVLRCAQDLSAEMLTKMAQIESEWTPELCHALVAAGRICVLVLDRANRDGQALLWLQEAPEHLRAAGERRLLVRDVVTAFAARGKGYGTALVRYAVREISKTSANTRLSFAANVFWGNDASVRMLRKAAFRRAGVSIALSRCGIVRLREADGIHSRLFGSRMQ